MAFYFDPCSVETSNLLPEGTYEACITDTADCDTKTGGKYLGLELTIVNNDRWGGHKLYDKLNYKCTSQKAQDIANKAIKTIIVAKYGEKRKVENEAELLNTLVLVQVSVEHDNFKNDDVNKIKFYKLPNTTKKDDVAW